MEPISQTQINEVATEKDTDSLHHKKNLYPVVRHILLVAVVLCTLSIILFLLYQNGKSIYDNGI